MSKDGSSGESGCQDSSAGGSPGDTAVKDVNASIYENKEPKKIVRIITVLAYMFSVSFVAIVLSAYYIFLWEPPNPRLMHGTAIRLRADPQLNFLRAELPSKTHLKETISQDSSSRNNNSIERTRERIQGRTLDYDGFEESLTSLKTTLAELIRERNNNNNNDSSSIGEYFITRGNNENYEKINEKINSRWKNLRMNYNTTRYSIDRREKKDKLDDTTLTDKIIYNNSMDDRRQNEEGNNKEKTQIEKMTAKTMTTNGTMDDTSEMSMTTLREKSLFQILTESTKSKEVLPYVSSSVASTELQMVDVVAITETYEENKSRN
ncbi:MATH and LRR domain-containing protein PFE0570w isoform X1 [Vespa crabro]|uniref:MATH and LRR domain-containing protein PFE0570w isoform X1 n=1 Tax=Vespa crabro TaxID=7445 RepID=UPI001F014611|nr:MATH and LRR domain-containing protein PFE0570w isoform X1 [Vespa crabro]